MAGNFQFCSLSRLTGMVFVSHEIFVEKMHSWHSINYNFLIFV